VVLVIVALAAIGVANSQDDDVGTDDASDVAEGDTCDSVVIVQRASGSATVPGAETFEESSVDCVITEGSGDDEAVQAVQEALVTCNGQAVEVDGEYGPQTSEAVARVEGQNGLPADGVYDSQTLDAMRWPVTSPSGTTCVDDI
jgi:murein L,D-transpeptidase YcbB/YkuD